MGSLNVEDLDKVYVSSLSGKQIPLKQFVDLNCSRFPVPSAGLIWNVPLSSWQMSDRAIPWMK